MIIVERVIGHTVAFDLEYHDSLDRHIPIPKVVQVYENNDLGVVRAAAIEENLEGYGIQYSESVTNALKIINEIQPDTLVEKYNRGKKRKQAIEHFLKDKDVKAAILSTIDRLLDRFYSLVVEHNMHIIEGIERKVRLQQLRIEVVPAVLVPKLHFDKTQLGIKYSMQLQPLNGKPIKPFLREIKILTNDQPWILYDFKLYRLTDINGNKLRPFLSKDHIFVKNDTVLIYFQKIIVPFASKLDVETSGFDVIKKSAINKVQLHSSYDIFSKEMILSMEFDYGAKKFYYHDSIDKVSRLHIGDDEQISIYQTIRDRQAEQKYIDRLLALGLQINANKRLHIDDEEDDYAMLQFLVNNKEAIANTNCHLVTPKVEGKSISLELSSVKIHKSVDNDWFDIMGVIEVGEERIPLAHLMQHIREDNRFYELENGSYFMIPSVWMTRYKELAKFGVGNGDKVRVKKSQFVIVDDIDDINNTVGNKVNIVDHQDIQYTPSKNLKATLRAYQIEGVKWLLGHQKNGLGACLADDMGLGKTLQTLAVLSHTKDNLKRNAKSAPNQQMSLFGEAIQNEISPLRALIVLPAALVFNWYSEIKKFNPTLHTTRHIGPNRSKDINVVSSFDIVLTTYQTALRDIKILQKTDWEYIILDESQMIKNKNSKLFQAINTLTAINKISLSGTPIENSLSDLWSQMQFINDGMLGTFAFFKNNYLTPIEKQRDESASEELAKLVQPYILRRTKEEVAKDLPPLTEKVEYIDLEKEQKEIYDKVKSGTRNYLLGLDESDSSYRFHVFAALTKLRQIANHPILIDEEYKGDHAKLDIIINQMDSLVKAGHKVLIFSSFTSLLDIYKEECEKNDWKYTTLTGSDSQKKREQSVNSFQEDKSVSFFFISLKAGGVGLNLTAADYVFILDPWWNPFAEKQAIARAHRIGQDKPITVIRYIAKDTIEEKILKLQERKQSLSDDILKFEAGDKKLSGKDLVGLLD